MVQSGSLDLSQTAQIRREKERRSLTSWNRSVARRSAIAGDVSSLEFDEKGLRVSVLVGIARGERGGNDLLT
jgi:hypothetical protein